MVSGSRYVRDKYNNAYFDETFVPYWELPFDAVRAGSTESAE